MALLLAILSIVGAIPEVIKAVEYLWSLIRQIRDKQTKQIMTTNLRSLVMRHVDQGEKKMRDEPTLGVSLATLRGTVEAVLEKEHADFLAKA